MERHQFFEDYRPTNFVDDPLPVRVMSHSIWRGEILGQALDWATQYLHQRGCPNYMISPLLGKVVQELKTTDLSGCVATNSPSRSRYDGGDEDVVDADCVENAKYQPLKLMQAVAGKVDDICLKYKEANDRIDQDFPNVSLADSENPVVHALSAWSIKNSRRTQEDRMVVLPSIHKVFQLKDALNYFAVFDGHNGIEAAAYSCAHLHRHLVTSPDFPSDMQAALTYAFECTDTSLLMKFREENLRSGTTAVVTLLMPGHLYCAWAGDSQAILVKSGKAVDLVNPHKPEREDELERIRSVGGEVIKLGKVYRVNGNLAVSRAIGDPDYKDCVTSTPEIKHVELDGSEEFLVLACDGLWDVIEPDRAVEILKKTLLSSEPGAFDSVSKELTTEAKRSGSGDNITVIVVSLKPREELVRLYSSDTMNGTAEPMEIGGGSDVVDVAAVEVPPTAPVVVTKAAAGAKPAPAKPTSATKAPARTLPRPPVASARTSLASKPATSSTARPLTNKVPTATSRTVPSTTRLAAAKPLEKKPAAASSPTRQPIGTRPPISSRLTTSTRPSTGTSRPGVAASGRPKPEETEKSGTVKTAAAAPRPRPSTTLASTTRTSLTKPKIDVKAKVDAAAKPATTREPIAPRRSTPSMSSRPATAAPATRVSLTKSTTGLPAKPRVYTSSVPAATARTATAPASKRPSSAAPAAPKPSGLIRKAPAPLAKKDVKTNGHAAAAPTKVPEKRIITNRTKLAQTAGLKISEALKAEGPSVTETVEPPMVVTSNSAESAVLPKENVEPSRNESVFEVEKKVDVPADEVQQKSDVFHQIDATPPVVEPQAESLSFSNVPTAEAEDEPKTPVDIPHENSFAAELQQDKVVDSDVPSQDAAEPMAETLDISSVGNALPEVPSEVFQSHDNDLSHHMKHFSLEDRIFQQMGIQGSVEHDEDLPESPVDDRIAGIESADMLSPEPVTTANLSSSLENVNELQKLEQLEDNLLMDDLGRENADLLSESPIPAFGTRTEDKVNESLENLRETPAAELQEQVSPNTKSDYDQMEDEESFMLQRGGSALSEASGASFEGKMEATKSPSQVEIEVENSSSPGMQALDEQVGFQDSHSPVDFESVQASPVPEPTNVGNYPESPQLVEPLDEPEKTFSEEENALHRYDVEPTTIANTDMSFSALSPPRETISDTFAVEDNFNHRGEELPPERMDEEEDIKSSPEPVEPSEPEKSFSEEENTLHRYDIETTHPNIDQDNVVESQSPQPVEPIEPEASFTAEENALHQYDDDNGNDQDTCFATDIDRKLYSPMEISSSNTHDFGLPSSATNPFQMTDNASPLPEADLHPHLQHDQTPHDHEREDSASDKPEIGNQMEINETIDMNQAMAANTQFEQYASNFSDYQGHNGEDFSKLTAATGSDPTTQTVESHGYSMSPDSGYVNPLISPDVQDDTQTGRTSSFNSEFSSEPHQDDNDLDHSEEKLLPEESNSLSESNLLPNQPTPEVHESTPEPARSLEETHQLEFDSKNPFNINFEDTVKETIDTSPFGQMSSTDDGLHSETGAFSEIPKSENDRLLRNQFSDMFHGTEDPQNHNSGFQNILSSSGFEASAGLEKHGGVTLENSHFATNGSHSSHDRNLPDVTPEFNADFHSAQPGTGTNLDLVDFDKLSSSGVKSQSDALLD